MPDVLQLRQLAGRPDAYHLPIRIKLPVQRFNITGALLLFERYVNGRKNSPRQRQQVCRKDEAAFRDSRVIENFGRVAMRKQVVGLGVLVELDEVQVAPPFFAGAGRARLAVADHGDAVSDPSSLVE